MPEQLRPTLFVKKDDTRPFLDVELSDEGGYPLNLGGANITFSMRNSADGVLKVTAATCTILSELRGEVRHSWTSAMTDTAGSFEGEFTVTDYESRIQTFPSDGFINVIVVDSL